MTAERTWLLAILVTIGNLVAVGTDVTISIPINVAFGDNSRAAQQAEPIGNRLDDTPEGLDAARR